MAVALTSIFGSNINVGLTPRRAQRQYTGFAGAHGVTANNLGSRGFYVPVSGRLYGTGATYALARVALIAIIQAIELIELEGVPADYTYQGTTYFNCLIDDFVLPAGKKTFFTNQYGQVWCEFSAVLRGLI